MDVAVHQFASAEVLIVPNPLLKLTTYTLPILVFVSSLVQLLLCFEMSLNADLAYPTMTLLC